MKESSFIAGIRDARLRRVAMVLCVPFIILRVCAVPLLLLPFRVLVIAAVGAAVGVVEAWRDVWESRSVQVVRLGLAILWDAEYAGSVTPELIAKWKRRLL